MLGVIKAHFKLVNARDTAKIITFKFLGFTCVVYISHTVNVLVTDIILNNMSRELLISVQDYSNSLAERYIVCVKKQPGMPLNMKGSS